MDNKETAGIIAIAVACIFIFYVQFNKELYVEYPGFDEFYHLNKAHFIEEHYFLNYGWDSTAKERGLDLLGHYSPLYHIFLAFLFKLGINETSILFRIINTLPSVFAFFIFYFYSKKYFNKDTAFISTAVLLSMPIVLAQAQIVHPDSFVVLFSVLNCVVFFNMLDNKGSWLKQGLILGLSVLVKYNFLAVMFIFFSVLFFMKKLNKNHLKTAVIPVLFFALWTLIVFFGALSNGIDPYYEVKQIFVNLTTGATNLFKIPEKFLENFGLFASFFVFADVYFLYKKKFKSKSIVFLSVFFLFFFMLLATNHLDFRFLTPALPLLCTGQALIIKEFFKSRKLFPVIAVAFFVLLPFLYLNLYKIAYMYWVSPHGIHPISQFILEYETAVNIASPYPEILFWYNIDFNSVYNFGNFTDADSFVNELKANNVTHVIIIPDWCYGRGSNYYNICSFFSDVYREDVKMIYNYDKVFLFRIE